jgi:putative oxidoreductase
MTTTSAEISGALRQVQDDTGAARGERKAARVLHAAVRILLGLLFTLAGFSGFAFLFMSGPPAMPGLAGEFQNAFFRSHWVQFVDGVEALAGVLLLANRYVPVALLLLAGVIPNILAFHLTMAPTAIAPGLIAAALSLVIALRYRSLFAPIFRSQPQTDR